jgi:hypothetical protein
LEFFAATYRGTIMTTIDKSIKLSRSVRSGNTWSVKPDATPDPTPVVPSPSDPFPIPIDSLDDLRLGVLELYKTTYTPEGIGLGYVDQVLSIAPGETIEVVLETSSRSTMEQETVVENTESSKAESEDKTEKELTDSVSTLIQRTATSSVSMSASGPISVLSVGVNAASNYTDARSDSHQTTNRVLRQSTQRVSSEKSKRYSIKTRSVRETSARELHRRVITNSTADVLHYALRRCFQTGSASVQYVGPRLVLQHQVIQPGNLLSTPRLTPNSGWPTPLKPLNGSAFTFDTSQDNLQLGADWGYSGAIVRSYAAKIIGAVFSTNEKKITRVLSGVFNGAKWTATIETTIGRIEDLGGNRQQILVTVKKTVSSGNLPPAPTFQVPTIITFYLDSSLYSLMDASFTLTNTPQAGSITAEDALPSYFPNYHALLTSIASATTRNASDLRYEEREVLLRHLSRFWGVSSPLVNNSSYFSEIEALFDFEAAYHFLAPHGAKVDLQGSPAGLVYDVATGSGAATLGYGLGWKTHCDGDNKRNEFLNTPSALLNLPIRRGKEEDALKFFKENNLYSSIDSYKAIAAEIKKRINLERKAQILGLSEASVPLNVVTQKIDESTAPDDKLAEALFPVQSIFSFQEPVESFLYEPLTL